MALVEFLPATAGAGVAGTGFSHRLLDLLHLLHRQDIHHLVGVTTAAQQICHDAHGVIDMVEEYLVTGTQIVQSRLAVRCVDETVARAFSVTGEQYSQSLQYC